MICRKCGFTANSPEVFREHKQLHKEVVIATPVVVATPVVKVKKELVAPVAKKKVVVAPTPESKAKSKAKLEGLKDKLAKLKLKRK